MSALNSELFPSFTKKWIWSEILTWKNNVSLALSRVYIKNSKPEFDENSLTNYVHFVISNLPIRNDRLEQFNPFVPNVPFLYPVKTSENLMVFGCFQGVEKGCIGNELVKTDLFMNDSALLPLLKKLENLCCEDLV